MSVKVNGKVVLIGVGALAAVLLALACVLLFGSIQKLKGSRGSLEKAVAELETYYNQKPFPSDQNVKIEKGNIALLETWSADLIDICSTGQIESDLMRPTVFQRRLAERILGLRQRAKKSGVKLADRPSFGFHRYAILGRPPAPVHVSRLTRQMLIVDRLCTILMEEKVVGILTVRREQFEDAIPVKRPRRTLGGGPRPVVRAPATPAPARRGGGSRRSMPARVDAGEPGEKQFAYFRFQFDVKLDEQALWGVINRFAGDDLFIVVKGVTMKKQSEDVRVSAVSRPAGGTARTPAPRTVVRAVAGLAGKDDDEVSKAPPARNLRQVSGRRISKPMKVTLDVAVYTFKKAPKKDAKRPSRRAKALKKE